MEEDELSVEVCVVCVVVVCVVVELASGNWLGEVCDGADVDGVDGLPEVLGDVVCATTHTDDRSRIAVIRFAFLIFFLLVHGPFCPALRNGSSATKIRYRSYSGVCLNEPQQIKMQSSGMSIVSGSPQ